MAKIQIKNALIQPFMFIGEYGMEWSISMSIQDLIDNYGKKDGGKISSFTFLGNYTFFDVLENTPLGVQLHKIVDAYKMGKNLPAITLDYNVNAMNIMRLDDSCDICFVDLDFELSSKYYDLKKQADDAFQKWREIIKEAERVKEAEKQLTFGEDFLQTALEINEALERIAKNPKQQQPTKLEKTEAHQDGFFTYQGENTVLKHISTMVNDGEYLNLPKEKWNKNLYSKVKKILLNYGFEYCVGNKFKHENLDQAIDSLIECDGEDPKQVYQFFATPETLADEIIQYAIDILGEMPSEALEPSAGDGALIKALQRKGFTGVVDVYESWGLNINKLQQISNTNIVGKDFLTCSKKYDLIVANPPFSNKQDVLHITKMISCLNVGGVLVSICSDTCFQGKKGEEFAKLLSQHVAVVYDVPSGAFNESGTNIATKIIALKKTGQITTFGQTTLF